LTLPTSDAHSRNLLVKMVLEVDGEIYGETIFDLPLQSESYVTGMSIEVPDYSGPQYAWTKLIHFPFRLTDDGFYVRRSPYENSAECERFHLDETSPIRFISRIISAIGRCRRS